MQGKMNYVQRTRTVVGSLRSIECLAGEPGINEEGAELQRGRAGGTRGRWLVSTAHSYCRAFYWS